MMTIESFGRVICSAAIGWLALAGLAVSIAAPAQAAPAATQPATKAVEKRPGRGSVMDYGPFLSYTVQRPNNSRANDTYAGGFVAIKGITIHVGNGSSACFDTDTLSLAGGWTGGFLDLRRANLDNAKGETPAIAPAALSFSAGTGPGWANGDSFADPRPADGGPLPPEWAHYRGLYRHGEKVVFSYSVGKSEILELDGSVAVSGHVAFTRTIHLGASAQGRRMNLCELKGAAGSMHSLTAPETALAAAKGPADSSVAELALDGNDTLAYVINPPEGATIEVANNSNIHLDLPATDARTLEVVIATLPHAERSAFAASIKSAAGAIADPAALCGGGPALWPQPIVTAGKISADSKSAYVVDTVRLPDDNPWKSWMRMSGVDFFSDGRAAVCTWNGDVWIVSGLDDALGHVSWKRFAAGLYEPLGLKIVDDRVYVLGRDRITRLHDLNGDGEADYYENFCSAWPISAGFHSFNFDLQRDSKGNFYFTTTGNQASPWMRLKGVMLKVPREGGTTEVLCRGLRAANGLGIGPEDQITCSDNQGNWTPVDRINLVRPGGFYGFVSDPRAENKANRTPAPEHYDPPICWIRYPKPDNSAGGQVWAGKSWGPLSGQMLCTSYGQSALLEVLQEEVNGVAQGGVVKLPLQFEAGIMRGRVNPKDGQLWVCGLKGWETNSALDGCLQRVRYTGKPANMPVALHVLPTGLSITFSDPLDVQLAADEQSYGIEQWTYHWTSAYGSAEYKASDPKTKGHDEVPVKSAKVSEDHKTVTLETGPLKPVMQMAIEMHLKSADGSDIAWEIDNTINAVPVHGEGSK